MAHDYPEAIKNAINAFGKLPGIGKRSAERIVLSLLEKNNPLPDHLIDSIKHLTDSVKHCSLCGNYTESDPCSICADFSRDRNVICVVENPQDILSIEKSGGFRGLYHALMGRLSPLDGIHPEDLRIQELIDRASETVEVILALGTELESETTAIYIAKLLKNKNVKVSRIAYGISAGVGLEYADSVTLARALEGRRVV